MTLHIIRGVVLTDLTCPTQQASTRLTVDGSGLRLAVPLVSKS
jgi:hypothetical protein